jgi:hypothetical protein
MIRKAFIVVGLAIGLTACYPISPTPTRCAQEQFPPLCGCPIHGKDGPFFQPGVIYWPDNPTGLRTCR